MPKHDFLFSAIIQSLDNNNYLAEALFYPEITRFRTNADAPKDDLAANLTRIVEEDLEPLELSRRRFTTAPECAEAIVEVASPTRTLAWRKPLQLRFPYVHWTQGDGAFLAYVPALGIEILATSADELTNQIPAQIRAHLLRTKATATLGKLIWLQRCCALAVETLTFKANLRSPKQIAVAAAAELDDEEKKSVLNQVTTDLTVIKLPTAYELDDVVARLAEAFTARLPKSVLLVGKSGVGKTAAVHELVRQRSRFQLARTPFRATSGARLVAGMSGYGMWQERCQKLWREASKLKAILHVGNLIELMEVGHSENNSQGIAGFLRPYIARGDLLVIAECTPEQLPIIERRDPHLLTAFHRINVEEPSLETGRKILQLVAAQTLAHVEPAALTRLDQLHRRYATYSAYPGRPLRFLHNLLKEREADSNITAREVTAAFSRETGLPLLLLEDSVRLDLPATHAWFTERVIGQSEAVDLVTDLLATVKAGLVRPRKPIASLLFIGPTGTGKTEMAKSLAEFLFQDRHRLIRFDMSEYSDPLAVQRLIGGFGSSEGLLTSKVREQPFAVVLLDEVEKAHPQFFDLLLQVLGEGRLTDAAGRVADFCNAVVIMTSNLGAESYQRGVKGFSEAFAPDDNSSRKRASQHFLKEVRVFVRPELFNRIDRVVPFAPLSETTVQRIAERELNRIKLRDGLKYRGVTVNIAPEVAQHLARQGYDARYGARPLKRTIERELLAPLAEQLNQHSADEPLVTHVTLEPTGLHVRLEAALDETGKRARKTMVDQHLVYHAGHATALRLQTQRLARSPALMDLQNQIYRLESLERRLRIAKWHNPDDLTALAQLPRLRHVESHTKEFAAHISDLEDEAKLMIYGRTAGEPSKIAVAVTQAREEWEQLLLALYALRFADPDKVSVTIISDSSARLFQLANAYREYANQKNAELELYSVTKQTMAKKAKAEEAPLELRKIDRPALYLMKGDNTAMILRLRFTAPMIYPWFANESHLHLFKTDKKESRCLVEVNAAPIDEPLAEDLTVRAILNRVRASTNVRRLYHAEQTMIEDKFTDKRYTWSGLVIDALVAQAMDESLQKAAHSLLED
ncbi:MAG TPA: AAA family ATPase [Blastocatellia bacterium]|nr:AAA family ATPase [Blastocatellia bacterium]